MSGELHVVLGPGGVGTALIEALLAAEQPVRAVSRTGAGHLPTEVEQVRADALDRDSVADACRGASGIYSCLSAPYARWAELFPPVWSNVAEVAVQQEAKLAQMDNVYMYGDVGPTLMTEKLPYAAKTEKGQLRARLAEQLEAESDAGRLRLAVGRAPDFFGPLGRTSALGDQVFTRLVTGKRPQLLGDPDLPHTYAYLPDIGAALATLGQREEPLGRVWHLPCPETRTTSEIVELALAAAGSDARPQTAPRLLLRALGPDQRRHAGPDRDAVPVRAAVPVRRFQLPPHLRRRRNADRGRDRDHRRLVPARRRPLTPRPPDRPRRS